MTTQLDLLKPRKPRVTQAEFDCLLRWLADGEWDTAKVLYSMLYTSERRLRLIVEASKGKIISGNKGYKRTDLATFEEVQHYINRMKAHAKAELQNALDVERVWHERKTV